MSKLKARTHTFLLIALTCTIALLFQNCGDINVVAIGSNSIEEDDSVADHTSLQVTTGWNHSCSLMQSGGVKCWGANNAGQTGSASNIGFSLTPLDVAEISTAVQISGVKDHTCALLEDHSIKCWGLNSHGELGNGTRDTIFVPTLVTDITNATQVSAGMDHACALLEDKTVTCWGQGLTMGNSLIPVPVNGLSNVTQIAQGGNFGCALLEDQTVRCWGDNGHGRLGNGTNINSATPVTVSNLSNVIDISAAYSHACAVVENGSVYCWGENFYGSLGDGTMNNSSVPVLVANITSAAKVTAAQTHTCAILEDQTSQCWGYNLYGKLGIGTDDSHSLVPTEVQGLSDVISIAGSNAHACATTSDGTVYCWGQADRGKLGNGEVTGQTNTPTAVTPRL